MEAALAKVTGMVDPKERTAKYKEIIDVGIGKRNVSGCKQLLDGVLLEEVPLVVSRPVRVTNARLASWQRHDVQLCACACRYCATLRQF
jgi:hypothetical protein